MILAWVGSAATVAIRPLDGNPPGSWPLTRGAGPIGVQLVVLRVIPGERRLRSSSSSRHGLNDVGFCSVRERARPDRMVLSKEEIDMRVPFLKEPGLRNKDEGATRRANRAPGMASRRAFISENQRWFTFSARSMTANAPCRERET